MIVCENIKRSFPAKNGETLALDGVSLTIAPGEFAMVKGPSGCGKTTLLLTMGGMQRPSAGRVLFEGLDLYALPAAARNRLRAERIGFVFQLFHLVPYLTVRENVLAGLPPGRLLQEEADRADTLLGQLGLQSRAEARPGTLSAGERQRAALARALIKNPAVIFADEPTGNLDPASAAEVFRHLAAYHRSGGAVVLVTHGNDAASLASHVIHLAAGRVVDGASAAHSAHPVV